MKINLSLAGLGLELIAQTNKEIEELIKILREQYGVEVIEIPVPDPELAVKKLKDAAISALEISCIKPEKRPYFFVPRTIGRPQKGFSSVRIRKARTF